jgi:uncharacterized protein with ParB-like and HNH nuclease domain
MSYKELTIKDVILKIGRNEIYLPAIQRKFVWDREQIIKLFDSIMRGYPIGTFLFWGLRGESKNDYTFYKFIQEYNEKNNYLNEVASRPELKEEIIGVLDGQQRLSSMFIALQGTYAYKKPYARWSDDSAFPKRYLCLDLLKNPNSGEDGGFEFKFLTEDEITEKEDTHLWFPIKEILRWREDSDYILYAKSINKLENKTVLSNLATLWNKITKDRLISFFEIEEQDLDKILDIFVRVNSGGTILSKTDLLFSTIVAHWEKGREEIESLIETINSKGDGFDFDNDFVMRSCLVLTDCPVLFKVKTFKKENISKIKSNWPKIKESIEKTVDILVEFGFNRLNLTSQMAVIPIAYYIYNDGHLDAKNKNSFRLYLISSLLKKIYGGQGDQVLTDVRDGLRKKEGDSFVLRDKNFLVKNIEEQLIWKSLIIKDEDIDELMGYKKGPYTFMILSLLYPNLRFDQVQFHQDHIHPYSSLSYEELVRIGIEDKLAWKWDFDRNTLPNLQLLEGQENEIKQKTPFKEWFERNVIDKDKYKKENYIPADVDLDIRNFGEFFEKRRELLKEKIKEICAY